MSSPLPAPPHTPLIALVERLGLVLQRDMVSSGHDAGFPELKHSHNSVFGFLSSQGSHASDMAARAGVTRQSMGEIVRDLVSLGIVEMTTDPDDRRAKLVTYTRYGLKSARAGYQHIIELEKQFAEEFGDKQYEIVRDVLERLTAMLKDANDLPSG